MLAGFEGVTKRYGDLPALSELNLEVRRGEVLGLVGPNGAGKKTLLKLLCRFYDPTVGRISLDDIGFEECDPAQLRARLACVFQSFVRYDLTANENIRLGRAAEASNARLHCWLP